MRTIRIYVQVPLAGIAVALALASIACRKSLDYKPLDNAKATGASVHGLIYTEVDDPAAPQGRRKIFVPGVGISQGSRERKAGRARGNKCAGLVRDTDARAWNVLDLLGSTRLRAWLCDGS